MIDFEWDSLVKTAEAIERVGDHLSSMGKDIADRRDNCRYQFESAFNDNEEQIKLANIDLAKLEQAKANLQASYEQAERTRHYWAQKRVDNYWQQGGPDDRYNIYCAKEHQASAQKTHYSLLISDVKNAISDVRGQIKKLEAQRKQIQSAYDDFCEVCNNEIDRINIAIKKLEACMRRINKATNAINGIFTSCQIEGAEVLSDLKFKMQQVTRSFTGPDDRMADDIHRFSTDLQGSDFAEAITSEMSNSNAFMKEQRSAFDECIKQLDRYIASLEAYVAS